MSIDFFICSFDNNLNEELIRGDNAILDDYAGDTVYTNSSNKNKLVCSILTENIDPEVSCYPDEFILKIRDAYNERNPETKIINADTDIKGILSQFKSKIGKIGDTEDVYLTVFPLEDQMVFREKHFETTKYLRRKDDIYTDFRSYGGEYDTSAYHQFYPRLLRLEEKYPNFANINFNIKEPYHAKLYNDDNADLQYNNKYTHLFKDEYEKITHDDRAMFTIHKTFRHVYLVI